ncbi:MAG TPA: DUF5666 domain-containing protein [Verrucomicrobiae bacterium]|nr:DUF5666 domain-containing protein [Verrucomicrobiae bacterium]
MKKHIARIALFSLVAAGLVAVPATGRADDASKTNSTAAAAPVAKKKHGQFHGSVTAVDAAAMTLTVNAETIDVTSATIITKAGKPAVLSDIVVGDMVKGAYKKDDAGKMDASTITAGEKPTKKKKKTADTMAAPAATPAPAPGN